MAAVVIFMLTFAIPVTIYSVVSRKNSNDTRNLAAENQSDQPGGLSAPLIVSVPVVKAEVGQKYQYKIRAIDSDDDEIEFIVKEKPEWLSWNSSIDTLEGTPGAEDVGKATVQISASDGKWLNTQRFQITVSGEDDLVREGNSAQEDSSGDASPEEEGSASIRDDTSDYGISPVSQITEESGVVLGEQTELPETALPGRFLALTAGIAVFFGAAFLWADARFDLLSRFLLWYSYTRGQQIELKLGDGTVIDKKKGKMPSKSEGK